MVRVVFLGNAAWSVPSLEALAGSSHQIALVATRAPKPGGRGNRLIATAVAEATRRLSLPLAEVVTVKSGSGFEAIRRSRPDALVVVAYGEILPATVLGLPSVAPVNVHFSLLPELRGPAPVQRAILEGLAVTGVTTIRMDEGVDTGAILLQAEEAIDPHDDAGSLGARLAAVGGRLLVETLDRMQAGVMEERSQTEAVATYAPKLSPEDRTVDWTRPAEAIVRRVRALAPDPGAVTTFRGKGLKVLRGRAGSIPDGKPTPGDPGSVASDRQGLAVLTGNGVVVLEEVQPEGRRRMSGSEFVRGYRPQIGERLG